MYVDNAIDEPSLVRNNQHNDFGTYNLFNINSITLNKQAEKDNEVITKAFADQFHQENERSPRDVGLDFHDESNDLVKNNQDNDLHDNKLTKLDSVVVNREPSSDNELVNKNMFIINQIKILSLDLIKQFKIISNYPLEMIHIISPNTIKYN